MTRWKNYEDLQKYKKEHPDEYVIGDDYVITYHDICNGWYYDQNFEELVKCNLPDWMKEAYDDIGRKCKNYQGNLYTLIGISYTLEDFYYILADLKEKTFVYETCVSKLKFIDNE